MIFKRIEKHRFRKFGACSKALKNSKEYGKTLLSANKRLVGQIADIQHFFRTGNRNVYKTATGYLQGLWRSKLSNLEKITQTGLPDNYHQLQHFISDSPWDHCKVMDYVALESGKSLNQKKLIGLYLDESGVGKKGKESVGVAPQYCGNLGKVDNCQVAVFAAIGQGDFSTIVDSRLYLPKSWTDDQRRMKKAKIPTEAQVFKTKQQIALELIEHQISIGNRFDYINGDALYGADQKLTDAIDELSIPFIMDIRENQHVFLEEPKVYIPPHGARGRKPKNLKANLNSIIVKEYAQNLSEKDFKNIKVRNTAKGKLKCHFHFRTVWIWDKQSSRVSKRMLVIRKNSKKRKTEMKFALGNVSLEQFKPKEIAYMQAQRFFIEHAFKEAKSVLGLDQYQTRKWMAWYHQVALNMLLLLFILKEKLSQFKALPLLSAYDIRQILEATIVSSDPNTASRIIDVIYQNHKSRQRDINRFYAVSSKC